ncbi:hypothetical protein KO481_31385 [Nocardia sp. NEAU-G5]|uniref:DUF5709 domain-containing protein n=1 Tax=Nocardia albiluteola TaxID=2842303 RepID=A0ABS6B6T6_9NOCA|nr:hypothetical protein [Nocardia albiluteola]MBU3066007.1 hypothetical protein [Nocardia albiluteola]
MTPWEQAHPRPLGERLAEEQLDLAAAAAAPEPPGQDELAEDSPRDDLVADFRWQDAEGLDPGSYADSLGIAADAPREPEQIRDPPD